MVFPTKKLNYCQGKNSNSLEKFNYPSQANYKRLYPFQLGVLSLKFPSLQRGGADGVPNKIIQSLSREKFKFLG